MNSSWRRRPAPTAIPRTLPERPTRGMVSSVPASTARTEMPVVPENGRCRSHWMSPSDAASANRPSPALRYTATLGTPSSPATVSTRRAAAAPESVSWRRSELPSITWPSSSLRTASACFTNAISSPIAAESSTHTTVVVTDTGASSAAKARHSATATTGAHASDHQRRCVSPIQTKISVTMLDVDMTPSTVRDERELISAATTMATASSGSTSVERVPQRRQGRNGMTAATRVAAIPARKIGSVVPPFAV